MNIKISCENLEDTPENIINEFLNIFNERPFDVNDGGMQMESAFILFKVIKNLKPTTVIESGVWYGYTSWLVNKIDRNIKYIGFDPIIERSLRYKNEINTYYSDNFVDKIVDKQENCLLILDDHQDVASRILHAKKVGIKNIFFDDCYDIDFNHKNHPPTLMSYLKYDHGNDEIKSIIKILSILNSTLLKVENF